jgi:hypothetical protein
MGIEPGGRRLYGLRDREGFLGRLRTAGSAVGSSIGISHAPVALFAIAILLGVAVLLSDSSVALAAGPPQIRASWVIRVNATGADLRAEINPEGLSASYRFEYISDAAYRANLEAIPSREGFSGAKVPPGGEGAVGSGTAFEEVASHLSGLSPATSYRYRALAENSAGPAADPPEHVLTTKEFSSPFHLPDERGWELVSPVDKAGGAVAAAGALFGGGDIQAAAAPSSPVAPLLTYGSATAFGSAAGAPPASQYASRRTSAGWSTDNISTPLDSAAYGDKPDGSPYRVFSTDLSRALLFGGLACRGGLAGCPAPNPPLAGSGAPAGYMAYYLRDNASGALTSLLRAADVAHNTIAPPALQVDFAAASPDLSHVVLASCAKLTAAEVTGGPGECDPKVANLYEWSPASGLTLVNILPGGSTGAAGAEIAAPNGAVSTDGSRVYWAQGGNLYLREGAQTLQVDETQGGGGTLQTATPSGSVAFFTKAGHLYRFEAATKAASDLTPAGGVVGVLGAAADGNTIYYLSGAGLERWRAGVSTTVAPGADAAAASDYPPSTGTARVSDDGKRLAFLSSAALERNYDNTDANTKQPDTELYLFGPPLAGGAATLVCASCNPTGERPLGSSTIPGALVNGTTQAYRPRVLSADGTRLFFDSDDALAQDTNSHSDVYEWEIEGVGTCNRSPGCISLISSGRSLDGATFLDATADGSDAFFLTGESLVGSDPFGSVDAYDARVNGGLPEAGKPIPCLADACQGLPGAPEDPTPGTLVPYPGNPPQRFFGPRPRKHLKPPRHHRHHRRHGNGKQAQGGGRDGRRGR